MRRPCEEEIRGKLLAIISDGFNRSISTLRDAGAIDTRRLDREYRGVGTKYYDMVTAQIEYTAKYGAKSIMSLLTDPNDSSPDCTGTV